MTKEIIHFDENEIKQLSNLELLNEIDQLGIDSVHLGRYLKNHCIVLFKELVCRTNFLDEFYGTKTVPILARLYCLKNNLNDQPTCQLEGCSNKVEWDCGTQSFGKYCCYRHYVEDSTVQSRREQTMLNRYGVRTPMESEEFKQRAKETCIREFGVVNVGQRPDVKEKIKQTNLNRHGAKSFVESVEFKKKSAETCRRKYNTDHVASSIEFRQMLKDYWMRNYGVENSLQLKEVRDKAHNTFNKRYVEDAIGKELVSKHRRDTMQKLYGVNHQMELEWVKEKIRKTNNERFGCDYYSQTNEFHKKCHKRYTNPKYPDMSWADSWEFKVYDFLTEHNIPFEYQIKPIPYEYDGGTHYYHPDFLVNGRIYEVKGDNFFRINEETGKEEMYKPWRDPNISDEEYEWQCGKEEAKHQCMIANNVKILRKKEIDNLSVELFLS